MPECSILMAPWRSGYAGVCKTSYTGSIPVGASQAHFAGVLELVDRLL